MLETINVDLRKAEVGIQALGSLLFDLKSNADSASTAGLMPNSKAGYCDRFDLGSVCLLAATICRNPVQRYPATDARRASDPAHRSKSHGTCVSFV